jgi:hypothetical protein
LWQIGFTNPQHDLLIFRDAERCINEVYKPLATDDFLPLGKVHTMMHALNDVHVPLDERQFKRWLESRGIEMRSPTKQRCYVSFSQTYAAVNKLPADDETDREAKELSKQAVARTKAKQRPKEEEEVSRLKAEIDAENLRKLREK